MKWTVGKKIGFGFGFTLLILLLIGAVAFRQTSHVSAAARVVAHSSGVLTGLGEILSQIKDVETGQRGFLTSGDESFLEPYHAALTSIGVLRQQLRQLVAAHPTQQRRLTALEPLIDERIAEAHALVELRRANGPEATSDRLHTDKGKQLMDEIRQLIGEMQETELATLADGRQVSARATRELRDAIVLGTAAAAAFVLLAGAFLTRDLAGPINELSQIAERIGHGDVNVEFPTNGRTDEVGLLMQSFQRMSRSLKVIAGRAKQIAAGDLTVQIRPQSENDVLGNSFAVMTDSLRRLMQELTEAVNVLASSASEIMASTSQLASSATETAAAVTETTATVEEVKQTSQHSSEKARLVSDEAHRASDVAQNGKRAVEQTITGIGGIRDQMGTVAESILSLSAQSRAIGEIIATVDDLAAQSRLLAVNASIEAAKAGEEGKGFSVVAQEVKSLAEQSKQATTQVRGLLGEIQKATSSAVLATELGTKSVEAGLQQSTAAGESIRDLAENVAHAAHAATQIAATSQEQFVGMDQVAQAMENIKLASTQTVASTRQAEHAAQQLHLLGQKLKELADRFKV